MAIYRKWITILVILLGIQFASSQHIALLSHTPIVHDSQTSTLTCADLSENSTKVSLFIRREFTWSGSRTSESTYTRQVLKRRGMLNTWTGERVRKAIGAFGCGRGKDAVSAVKMHANGSLIPHAFTKLVISGSKVVIKMKLTSANTGSSQVGLRKVTWYKDGHILDTRSISRIWEAEGGRALVISSVKESDAGIYMAHHTDEDKINAAGTILIVRSCPLDKWGSSCDRKCPICLHGGVCNEGTGLCICSAGFSGRLCDQACEPSFFGGNCQHNCAALESEETSCQGFQLCSVVGCACMSGWMGLECEKACPPGLYGADCSQSCRCYHGGVCNRYKGCICTDQWTGPSCQVAKRDVINSDEVIPVEDSGNNDRLPSTTVEKKPNITAVLADPSFKVNQGQNVEVQCAVTGIPSPQHGEIILKRKNQIEIAPTETKMTETVTTSFFELTMGSYPGPFWCVATTSAGFAQKEFNFTIPVLPTPSNPPELVIKGATFLKLKLNSHPFIGDGPIKKTILLMKQSGQGRSFNTYERNIVNDTAEVRDLLPYTDYTFRVLLYREGGFSGRGHPGPTAVIKTDCGYPSSGPSIKNIHSKNNSILYLSWRLPPPSEIKGEVLGYKIYYRALGETSPSWTKVIFAYSSTTSATLKNMKPLAVYSVKIRLYNCAGDSPDSKEVRVTMGRLKKPDGPNVTLVNQTSRCLGFTWKPPTNAKPYTISGYEVSFEETTNPSADRLNILQNVSGMVFTRNSLTPYTTYKFRVRAYNHEGPGNFSDEMNVTTNEEAPGQPSNFHVESRTPFQIELSWDVPLQPNGIITQYIINSSRDGEIWKQKTTPGDERSVSILGLAEYTKYLFQIQAVTIEPGAWSVVLEARTMSLGPLEPPQSIDVNSPSPQSVSLSWLPPPASIYVHKVKQYKIIYTDDLRQRMEHWKERLVDGTKRSEEIMNLRSDTVYLFAMAAVTQRPGPFSERKTIRTRRLGVPPPPKNVYLTNVTSNSAIIHWKVENGYSITNVRIRIKSGNTLEWQDLLYLASSERAMLEQLDSGTRYSIELTAGNHNGESSGNPIKNFQTLEASVIGEGIILQVLVPVLVAVVAILFGIIVYCKCRGRSDSDSMSTAPLEMDSISNHMRVSTIGSSFLSGATINSRSGTLLSSHSVHSGNSRAPSTHSGQLLLAESLIICWENILFEDIALGEGNFGQVVKAVVQREDKLIQVAVKMLKDGCSVDDRKDFLAELDMMARLGNHKNIISLVGACENDSSLYLCTEYAPNGNLLQFLRKSRHSGIDGTYTTLTQNQLLQFALDVCEGMAYLSDKQLIHRDLAARNVLLSGNLTCKVADFGLSRGEGVYVKKTVARLPIRWMAIESLNYNVYTTKSDVWSFGVLLWEIVSLGGTPYYGMSCAELYEKLPQGYRMEQPLNCDSEVYKLMSQCWKNRPYDRPSFSQLCVALRRMIDARSSRNYVNTSVFENFMFATIDANEEEG